MVLGFKQQFKDKILNGDKIHTIRARGGRRWKKGTKIHFATGVRTKNYDCFKESEVQSTQRIFMTYAFNDIIEISIDDRYVHSWAEVEAIAKNDGFDNYEDFFNWFYPLIQKSEDKCFSGILIHWTNRRYE